MAVTGWRCWDVTQGELRSPIMHDYWPPGESLTAQRCGRCRTYMRREWPNRDCSCGVYSYLSPGEAAWQSAWNLKSGRYVMGTVGCWGRTVPHQYGQRSLHARITGFYLWPNTSEKTLELLLKYPVPILQAEQQPWWDPQFVDGRLARGASWHSKQPPEPKE